ncbi:hypothetical protein ABZT28_28485, partial [Streptomyces sp. NPDC005388]|uniref:hypothetical protein n=1 Tax=Streptomyces sp. NPDC005388 TaxID=3156717 RepID=UPI0033A857C7
LATPSPSRRDRLPPATTPPSRPTVIKNYSCRVYPSISTWSLTVSDADSFADIKDELPAVSAASGEYRVLAWPYREGVCLFLTSDPTEAVEFAAELIEARRADTSEGRP